MISLRRPMPERMRRFLTAQSELDYSYASVGATASTPPAGYVVDRTRVELGRGEATYQQARRALAEWRQFALGWLSAWPTETPIRQGETILVLARAVGLWWLNAARIVYVVDESDEARARFGFAYGTLPGHVEAGEERFLIERDRDSDTVYYDIFAFSRPRHFLTRLGKRHVRRMQQRFGRDSAAAMRQAVERMVSAD